MGAVCVRSPVAARAGRLSSSPVGGLRSSVSLCLPVSARQSRCHPGRRHTAAPIAYSAVVSVSNPLIHSPVTAAARRGHCAGAVEAWCRTGRSLECWKDNRSWLLSQNGLTDWNGMDSFQLGELVHNELDNHISRIKILDYIWLYYLG